MEAPPEEAAAASRDSANVVGKYIRTSRLGAGGMGEVWKAWDTVLRRWVALKFLKGEDPDELARFLREAQIAARLSHPNIGAVYETGDHAGRPFIAMQFIAGQTLASVARSERRQLVELMRDAARAVHYAHEQGVIHRDLKPANLMVEKRRAYVMDFGLARPVSGGASLSVSGMLVGTPAYMSPEQARGERADARSDVYGLGATLYELLVGRPPFADTTVYDLLVRVVSDEPEAPRRLDPALDPELETIVLKCLEKDATRRYATAQALADDLERWLGGEPIQARPASTFYRVRKRLWRHKGAVSAVAACVAAATVCALVVPRWIAESRARERRERELEAVRELGARWTEVLMAKQLLHNASSDPATVRAALARAIVGVGLHIERHPALPQGRYVRARARLYLDDLPGAEEDLRAALAADDTFVPGHALLARTLLERYTLLLYRQWLSPEQRRREAEPLLREAERHLRRGWTPGAERESVERWGLVKSPEDDVGETVLKALVARYIDGDRAAAVRVIEKADATLRSEEHALWLGRLTEDLNERIRLDTEALVRMPLFAKAYHDRANALREVGRTPEAVSDFSRALEIRPASAPLLLNRGGARMELGDLEGALSDFSAAIDANPRYAQAWVNRASVLRARGDLDAAVRDCTRALEIDPRLSAAVALRRMARMDQGDRAGAIADCTRAIELDPMETEAWSARAFARGAEGDIAGALEDYDRAIALDPSSGLLHRNRGSTLMEARRPREALDAYTRAIELEPHHPNGHLFRGNARQDLGDLQGAIRDFSRAIELDPRHAMALTNRGVARAEAGDPGAIDDFTRAIEADPRGALAYGHRGLAHHAAGRRTQALDDLTRAIELNPRWPEALTNRGIVRQSAGEHAAAIGDFSRAIELDGRYALAWVCRALSRRALGEKQAASADCRRALEVAPADWPHRSTAERLMRELGDRP